MKRIITYLLLIIFLITVNTAQAQFTVAGFRSKVSKVGTVAVPFLTIGIGARANAMGGAFTSVANDVTALYWNPAGIATLDNNELTLIHSNWIADLRHDFIALALPLGSLGSIGFSLNALTMDEILVRTPVFPEGTGEKAASYDMAIAASYAYQLTDRLSLGGSVKYIRSVLWHMSAQTMAVDLGVVFTNVFDLIRMGASISNMGGKIKYSGRDTYVYHDIRPSEHGNNDRIDAELRTGAYGLPVTFRAGLSTIIYKNSNMPFLVAVDLTEPSDNYRSMNVGGEWSFYDTVFLRAGYSSIFEPDSEKGVTVGAGLKFDIPSSDIPVLIDYSYEDFGILNNAQRFSLSIAF
jgi:hypothetical protein